jgi:hypothetical protein
MVTSLTERGASRILSSRGLRVQGKSTGSWTGTQASLIDQRQVHGHAFPIRDESMHFILRNIPIAGRFEPGKLERQDIPLYPPLARRARIPSMLSFCATQSLGALELMMPYGRAFSAAADRIAARSGKILCPQRRSRRNRVSTGRSLVEYSGLLVPTLRIGTRSTCTMDSLAWTGQRAVRVSLSRVQLDENVRDVHDVLEGNAELAFRIR